VIRTVRLLNVRRLRHHPLRSAIAVLSIVAGVSLAVGVLIVQLSFTRTFEEFGRSFAGPAPLRVVGPAERGTLATGVLPKVDAVPGVRAAIPVVQAVTVARHADGEQIPIIALGFDCRVTAIINNFRCSPDALAKASDDAPPVMSRSLLRRLGPDGAIRTNLGLRPVKGAFGIAELDRANDGNIVAFALPVAQRLYARPATLDAIYVVPDRGVDIEQLRARIQDAIGRHNGVLRSTDPPVVLFLFTGLLVPLLGMVSLFALAIGAVLVHNAMTLAMEDRRRDLAITAALGSSPRAVFGGTLAEAALLGLVGGVLGAGLGFLIAGPILAGSQTLFARMSGLHLRVYATWPPVVVGASLGAVTAVIASIRPARRAVRVDVVAELRNRHGAAIDHTQPSPKRLVLPGVAILLGCVVIYAARSGSGLERWQPIAGSASIVASTIAMGWFVLAASPLLFRAAARVWPKRSASVALGWTNIVREPRRTAVMLMAVTSVVALGIALGSINEMIVDGIAQSEFEETDPTVVVSTMPTSNTVHLDARPSPALAAALAKIPGVATVGRVVGIGVGSTAADYKGVTASDRTTLSYPVLRGTASLTGLERGEVLVGPVLAREHDLHSGSTFRLAPRDGFVDVKVQGVWANGDFNGREITMSMDRLEQLYGPQSPVSLIVRPAEGVDADRLAGRIEAANLDPDLIALGPAEQLDNVAKEANNFIQPFWALQRGLYVVTFAAVLFTLLLAAAQRRRELGLVAAVGMSPGGLAKMVLSEALAVGVVGSVTGLVLGLAFGELFRQVAFLVVPFEFASPRLDVVAPVVLGAAAIGLLLAAAALPAWRTARLQVVEAIRYE
jgi:putative ABC transport system permease protein